MTGDEFPDELEEEQWLAEWDQADRDAVDVLRTALPDHRGRPAPSDRLAVAATAVRAGLRDGNYPFSWVRRAAELEQEPAPDDDVELLLRCVAATISPQEETGLDIEEEAILVSLEHADWLGAIVSLVRGGPGGDTSPRTLVEGIRTCPEVELDSDLDIDDESHLAAAFSTIELPWHVLGLVDRDDRLTELGEWVLPRALARAWNGDFDAEPDPADSGPGGS
jgi:hypothetical protein